ncbi:MAG TPA: YCF48-related protein [Candidatus Saccharimonadales bacterium]|nr:YCF48-related protein [Candidatus Saccharimonadales bacterium]
MERSEAMTKFLICGLLIIHLSISSFSDSPINLEAMPQLQSAAFIGLDRAWFVTFAGDILFTVDGGETWRKQPGEGVGGFEHISFLDSNIGWVITKNAEILRTSDGAKTWTAISRLDYSQFPFVGPIEQISFVDNNHGWVIDPFSIWRTEDGGVSWKRCAPFSPPNTIRKLTHECFFINERVGWLAGEGGVIHHTTDGGKTWKGNVIAHKDSTLGGLHFIGEQHGWVLAWPDDGIYHTEDGGKTWNLISSLGRIAGLQSVHFTSRNEGWAIGFDRLSKPEKDKYFENIVLHTIDGGQKWERVKVGEKEPILFRVHFVDQSRGWLLARDNAYRTEDGGKTWRIVLKLLPLVKSGSKQ